MLVSAEFGPEISARAVPYRTVSSCWGMPGSGLPYIDTGLIAGVVERRPSFDDGACIEFWSDDTTEER